MLISDATKPAAAAAAPTATEPMATIAYWLTMLAVYVFQGALWYFPAKEKIFDDGLTAPAGIHEMFAGSFIESFPGTDLAWAVIGLLQGVIVVGLAVSLVRREFLPGSGRPILLASMTLGLLVFALLLFGNSMVADHEGVASLSAYFGVTAVLIAFVASLRRLGMGR
jgi:hypothetical protein